MDGCVIAFSIRHLVRDFSLIRCVRLTFERPAAVPEANDLLLGVLRIKCLRGKP